MTELVPLMGSGGLTLITFAVVVAFIVLGSMSLLRHTRRITAPFEADLTPEGRAAQEFEHTFIDARPEYLEKKRREAEAAQQKAGEQTVLDEH